MLHEFLFLSSACPTCADKVINSAIFQRFKRMAEEI